MSVIAVERQRIGTAGGRHDTYHDGSNFARHSHAAPRSRSKEGLSSCEIAETVEVVYSQQEAVSPPRRNNGGVTVKAGGRPLEKPLWEQKSFPEKLFRFIVLLCIVGWGLSAIYVVSHVGPLEEPPVRTRDLASYFFTAIWIFVFFYAQYRVVPRFIHRDLDRRVRLWHAGGSLALLIIGALSGLFPQGNSDVPSGVLFWLTLLGEGVLIGNVIWSYVNGEREVPFLPVVPSAKTTPERVADDSPKNLGWPKSPAKLFGIGAVFFGVGGLISVILNVPAYPIPVPAFGQLHFLPYGCLWLAAAVPFAIFALLYKYLTDAHRIVFEESLNRIHFVVTIIAVFDLVRVFVAWEQALVSNILASYFGPEIRWLVALFGFSAVVFAINAYHSYRRTAART
jgi:hypothetical protein